MSLLKPVRDADFFSKKYFESIVKECPKLANCNGESLNDYMLTVLAFNLAYNAFYRGERRTAAKLLSSVLKSENLSDEIFRAASLLEIQICIELNRQKYLQQAHNLLHALATHPAWSRATPQQLDCYEFLSARARSPNYRRSAGQHEALHWILLDAELEMKAGEARAVLSKLLQRRATAEAHERILLDNALGCLYANAFKDFNLAETYFRSAMVREVHPKYVIPVRPSTLIYHTALSQLAAGRPKSAFYLFCAVWPFHHDNPRTWLRIAECCMQLGTSPDTFTPTEDVRKAAKQGWDTIRKLDRSQCVEEPSGSSYSASFVAYVVHYAISMTIRQKDFFYLLPYLYSLYAFANIQLRRYEVALKAAEDMLSLASTNPQQRIVALFYKSECLAHLNRLPEALGHMQACTPLQSLPWTGVRVNYNRALLETLSGNFEKASEHLKQTAKNDDSSSGNTVHRPESVRLSLHIAMRLRRQRIAQELQALRGVHPMPSHA